MRYCCLILLLLPLQRLAAQHPSVTSDEKAIRLIAEADSVWLDSLSLVPGSLQVSQEGTVLDSQQYKYHYSTGYLHWQQKPVSSDSLTIRYRVLPFSLHATHRHRSLAQYDSNALFNDIRQTSQPPSYLLEKETLFASPKLTKSGSISRGIAVGNRQSVFVQSSLNLQMAGALTEDISIRAAITDQHIPAQPDGNTQQLQQFDNVFIELYNDQVSLTAGDMVLQPVAGPASRNMRSENNEPHHLVAEPYFMRFQRHVQGGKLRVQHARGETDVGLALSKGRFASVNLAIQEGVQGPYQLTATSNSQNIQQAPQPLRQTYYILANSEKVYLDGRLLRRGYDQDYTIDYNLGEINFTTRVMLTQNSRVNVDFGYADRSFSRHILTAGHRQQWDKVQWYTRFFQEKDNRRQTLGLTLTEDDQLRLYEAGDAVSGAWISAVDSVGDTGEQPFQYQHNLRADIPGIGNLYAVRYQRVDTLAEGQPAVAYVFDEAGAYEIDFTFVGQGQGDYVLAPNAVNGKVFRWIAPVDGQQQGTHTPARQLTMPQHKRLLITGGQVDVTAKDKIFSEAALSSYDRNTFSPIGDGDNVGQALTVGYAGAPRKTDWLGKYAWSSQLRYEYVQQNFTPIDPYRAVEFERSWSVMPSYADTATRTVPSASDHLWHGKVSLEKNAANRLAYQLTARHRPGLLQGYQQHLSLVQAAGAWQASGEYFQLYSNMYHNTAEWRRVTTDLHYGRGKVVPGYRFRLDKNQVRSVGSEAVLYSLNNYLDHQWYLRSGDSTRHTFQLDYTYQTNYQPVEGKLAASNNNQTIGATGQFSFSDRQQLVLNMTYRRNQVQGDSWDEADRLALPENTLMGRLDWKGVLWKDIIRVDVNYAIANGREIRREFVYVRVPVGEGLFTWRDDNGNSVEELEEFYEAQYWDEKNYVRVYVATQEYMLAYTNQLQWQTQVQFPAAWRRSQGLKSWLAHFSNTTYWSIDNKISDTGLTQRLSPWSKVADQNLLYEKDMLRSTLFFNRHSTVAGADLGLRMQRRKQLLNAGFEARHVASLALNTRWNVNRSTGLQMTLEKSQDANRLDLGNDGAGIPAAPGRNYHMIAHRFRPAVHWQPHMNLRISTQYGFQDKVNKPLFREEATAQAITHTTGWEVRYQRLLQHHIQATAEYIYIRYQGETTGPLSYVMLDALQPGDNVRWTLSWQQKLWNGLQLTAHYQGRKSPAQPAIHTGNVMVQALF